MTSPRGIFCRLRDGGERGSLPIAMLFTLVGLGLSGLMLSSLLTQVVATRRDSGRIRALNAAQAGLDVGLAHIRAAVDTTGRGLFSKLPCSKFAATTTAGGTGSYSVTTVYYSENPQGKDQQWLTDNDIPCLSVGAKITPDFALLTSIGTDTSSAGAAGATATIRTLYATYAFQILDANIPGGLIRVYELGTSANDLCMDAGRGSPTAGTPLLMQPCSPDSPRQKFSYNLNLTLGLAASKTPLLPLGMCLEAGPLPHVVNHLVTFEPCAPTTLPQQQWSLNDSANFMGTSDGRTLDGFCFNVQRPDQPGSPVILGTGANCRRSYDNIQNFQPEATVGAGASGTNSGQLVNYLQFGRCLDVTDQNVDAAHLIIWPCKQAPDPANITWNQRWTTPALDPDTKLGTGPIRTNPPAGGYCLDSPLISGAYVRVRPCPTVIPASMTWTISGNTGTYGTSYRIVDTKGYCLTPTDPAVDAFGKGSLVSKTVALTCGTSPAQKWNAPPELLNSVPLRDIGEN